MKKFLLLLCALLGTVGAWATDVKIAETSSGLPTAVGFGSFSGQVFTTSAGSGLAGVTVTASTGLTIGEQSVSTISAGYGNCFKLVTAAASTNYTVTLAAPEGYFITGYYMGCSANSDGKRHTITPAGWTEGVVVSSPPYNSPNGPKVIEVTGLNANSTSFTISTANEGNTLYLPTFTIYVAKAVPVTYVISDANGVVFTSDPINAGVGTTITTLPASLQRDYCNYTVPSTVVEDGDNTINVTVDYTLPFTPSTSFSDAVWYYATLRGKYLRADDSAKDGSGRYSTNSTNEHTDAYKWAFFGNPYSNFYIANKNQGEGKYLYAGTNPEFQTIANPTADNKALWVPSANNAPGFTLRSVSGATLYINDAGNGGNLGYWNSSWGATDGGSRWVVEEAPASEVTVTYNVVLNNQVVATASEMQGVGGEPSVPASLNYPYTSYTYNIDVIPGSATTVTATPVFNMPFTASTDYATATWYYLNGHASYSDRYVSTNGTEVVWSVGKGITEAYQWAFIGNPIEGIKIINKATGATHFLQETNPLTMATTDKSWTIKQQTNTGWQSGANGFGLWSEVNNQYVNTQGSTLKYWSSFDQGSTLWVTAVPDNYASNVQSEIKPWFDNYGGYFQLKTSVVEANQAKYEPALVNCDLETYQELTGLIADANNYVFPETGFYRIKSIGARAVGESYIAYGKSSGSSYYGLITKTATAANQDATTVFYINKQSNGKYTMTIQGLNVQAASKSTIVSATSADAPEFTFIPLSPGYAAMTVNGGQYEFLHESGWTESGLDFNAVLGWTADADASQWTVEAVETLTVPLNGPIVDEYYATLCLPFDVTLSGATAYTLTKNGIELTLSEGSTTVAAGTPVLLVGAGNSATATIGSNYATTPVSGTALTGTYLAKTINGTTDYVLGTDGSKVGFFHWNSNNLKANRAYVAGSTGGNVKGFYLNFDEADKISEIAGAQNEGEIYNLAGQRLNKLQKGVNIVNGKKVIVK
jgi:hypothetical protein